ncbi:MAG: acetolactate synthase small subunit [Clostridiales bacterium]|nr:acetolactate synthase small subunit [Clostridiales bacterium]
MKRTFAVLVENKPGVLSKVAGLFSRRGYNIESLVVSETEDSSASRMTIVVEGDMRILEQVGKQLNKLIDVIKVNDITEEETVERQLCLIRVTTEDQGSRQEIMQITEVFRCHVVDISRKSLIVEATGDEDKVQAVIRSLKPFGITELVRTGKVAMIRGMQ